MKLKTWTLSLGLAAALSLPGLAQESGQQTFANPDEAVKAMVAAAQSNDDQQMISVFGGSIKGLLHSADKVNDTIRREEFVKHCGEKLDQVKQPDGSVSLVIGLDHWPFPIPLKPAPGKSAWYFDTPVGKQAVLLRRIGQNELETIETLYAYSQAQRDYFSEPRDGPVAEFACRMISSPGKHDGLYWPTKEGEVLSPFGSEAAKATAEGYDIKQGKRIPYHGYCFRILTAQGPGAPGGAYDYFINGHMVGGFAMIAWPAEYKNTGIMTFIINQDGQVYQTNLGADTAQIAPTIKVYDPKGWTAVSPP